MKSIIQLLISFLVCLAVSLPGVAAQSQQSVVYLSYNMPEGVNFQVLAEHQSQTFRFHTDAMRLDRITLDCGQVTGKLFGMEQLTYVEYGSVDVHSWDTGNLIVTLSAGDSFGPMSDESSFFLTTTPGHRAQMYHFSHGGAGLLDGALPDFTYESTNCDSGAMQELQSEPASVETMYSSDQTPSTSFGNEYMVYVGVLTVEPGSAIGWLEKSGVPAYVSQGTGIVLPLVGGFGKGEVGKAGIVEPEVRPEQVLVIGPQQQVALENHGSMVTVALVFGVVEIGDPVFQALHS